MDVGFMMLFASYGWENCSDAQTWNEELRLAELAADSGFDVMWSTEHHFEDYSFCPDNVQLMTHLAAKHPHIDVGTAAVILPWHDPLRVAEQVAMLDMLSSGRLRFGMGRGLAAVAAIPIRFANLVVLIPRVCSGRLDRGYDCAGTFFDKMQGLRDARDD